MQLSSQQLWQRYQDYLYSDTGLGFRLDISRVYFQPEYLEKMASILTSAFQAMDQLEQGAIANTDENRMVGHYWLRDPELVPSKHPEYAEQIRQTNQQIRQFAEAIHRGELVGTQGRFENVLHIGIGGSALGPQFIADALGTPQDKLRMFFFDNTDPNGIDRVLQQIGDGLGKTLVTIASKSGGTPETRNGMLEVQHAFAQRGLNFSQHAVAITQEHSQLDKLAVSQNWIARFGMWDWVGGRTSVTSAVGLLPAALQGLDIQGLLDGAAAMDRLTRVHAARTNPAALLALMWYKCTDGRGSRDMVILPYKDRLALFSKYLQQLVMESLGKEFSRNGALVRQGIAVYGNKGSTDQHAYVQQLREGVPNFFVTFIQVLKDRQSPSTFVEQNVTSGDYLHGFWQGTRQALSDSGIDLISITLDDVTPRSVGAMIALYERAVGLYAELINVNAYHQPGVEAGKKAAKDVLDLQLALLAQLRIATQPMTAGELTSAIGKPDSVESAYFLLQHMSANPDHGIHQTPGRTVAEDRFAV